MRKLLMVLCLVAISYLGCKTKTKEGFHLTGKLLNTKAGTKVSLEEISFKPFHVTDTTSLNSDGSFDIHGFAREESVYLLKYDNGRNIYIVLDEKPVDIYIEADTTDFSVKPYIIKGSPKTSSLYSFVQNVENRINELRPLFSKVDSTSTLSDSLKQLAKSEIEIKKKIAYDYIVTFCDTVNSPALSIFLAESYLRGNITALSAINNTLEQRFPQSRVEQVFSAELKKAVANTETHQVFKTGQLLPDITAQGIDGNERKLSSLKGQYVLVDFWASWCNPCRAENPNVVEMYTRYKNKGFNVFSVSLDDNKDKWKQAIQQDKLIWPNHVSDLNGWKSSLCGTFGIRSIPSNYLIDKEGKVIGFGLRGADLENKLKEIFK